MVYNTGYIYIEKEALPLFFVLHLYITLSTQIFSIRLHYHKIPPGHNHHNTPL